MIRNRPGSVGVPEELQEVAHCGRRRRVVEQRGMGWGSRVSAISCSSPGLSRPGCWLTVVVLDAPAADQHAGRGVRDVVGANEDHRSALDAPLAADLRPFLFIVDAGLVEQGLDFRARRVGPAPGARPGLFGAVGAWVGVGVDHLTQTEVR